MWLTFTWLEMIVLLLWLTIVRISLRRYIRITIFTSHLHVTHELVQLCIIYPEYIGWQNIYTLARVMHICVCMQSYICTLVNIE